MQLIYSLPISHHKIHRQLKEKLKIEHSHLTWKFHAKEFDQVICFLQGYYHYMQKDLMPPYDKEEVSKYLLHEGYGFLVKTLEKE